MPFHPLFPLIGIYWEKMVTDMVTGFITTPPFTVYMLPYTANGIWQMGVRILKWGVYPGLSRWAPNAITRVLTKGKGRETGLQRDAYDVTTKVETR